MQVRFAPSVAMGRDPTLRAPLTFARRDGGRLQIAPAACAVLWANAQVGPSALEAGGVLLGRHIRSSQEIIIDTVTTPLPGDLRSRFQFHRSRRRHQEAIDRAWADSNGTCTYLGEWHTHPEPDPRPSVVDWLGWLRKLLMDQFSDSIFFVVVGTAEVRAWEGRRRGRPRPLRTL